MANYYNEFSESIEHLTTEETEWLKAVLNARTEDGLPNLKELAGLGIAEESITDKDDTDWPGFQYAFRDDYLWLHSDESFHLDNIIAIVQHFILNWRPGTLFSLQWANTCSSPMIGAFGGGVCVISQDKVLSSHTDHMETELRGKINGLVR